ncbi:phage tail protein [Halomonas organivorans]
MPDLKYDIRELNRLRKQLGEDAGKVEKALIWSTNRMASRAATFISRDLRGTYALKARDIKGHLKIQRVRRDPTRALLYTGKKLPLEQFKPKARWVTVEPRRKVKSGPRKGSLARRRGVSVRVRKDKGRQLVKGGWLAKGHVLRRADRADNRSDPRIQYGPSVPGMVAHPSTIEGAQELVRRELPKEFSGRLDYLLSEKTGLT